MGASVLLSSLCLAAVFAVPEMPEAEWDDTEVVTNAALPLFDGLGHDASGLSWDGFAKPVDLWFDRQHSALDKNTVES